MDEGAAGVDAGVGDISSTEDEVDGSENAKPLCSSMTVRALVSTSTKTSAMLRNRKPLSDVLLEFLSWVESAISSVSEATNTSHYPGTVTAIQQS